MGHTIQTLEKIFAYVCLSIIFAGAIHFYILDVRFYNPIITYTQGVDPNNLKLDKKEYKIGDKVYFYTSFCKHRFAVGTIDWTLVDGQNYYYPTGNPIQLSEGCYPEKQDKLLKMELKQIPEVHEAGCYYHFTGVAVRYLPDGRSYRENQKTENFCITK